MLLRAVLGALLGGGLRGLPCCLLGARAARLPGKRRHARTWAGRTWKGYPTFTGYSTFDYPLLASCVCRMRRWQSCCWSTGQTPTWGARWAGRGGAGRDAGGQC